jgi:hypothetical protein
MGLLMVLVMHVAAWVMFLKSRLQAWWWGKTHRA